MSHNNNETRIIENITLELVPLLNYCTLYKAVMVSYITASFLFYSREKLCLLQQAEKIGGANSNDSTKAWLRDPNPHGSALILVGWIRIRIGNADPDPHWECRSGSTPGGQKRPQQ
jgi:hypothetical protein